MSGGCSLLASTECLSPAQTPVLPHWAFLPSPSSWSWRKAGEAPPTVTHCHSPQGASTLTALRGPASLSSLRAAQLLFSTEVKFT